MPRPKGSRTKSGKPDPNGRVLTVAETAAELRLSLNACYSAIARGEIPAVKIGSRILVPRAALDRMIAGAAE